MRKLNLVTDIGNTSISLGFFDGDELINTARYKTAGFEIDGFISFMKESLSKNKIQIDEVSDGIISSVVPTLSRLVQICLHNIFNIEFPFLENKDNKIVKLDVDEPETVGGDLIGDLVAAKKIYSYPIMIIDLGTLTKVLIINDKGDFDRAAFFAGMRLSLHAMNSGAELIPELDHIDYPKDYFGKNTIDAMKSGVYYSMASVVAHLVDCRERLVSKGAKVVISGGYADIISKYVKGAIVDPDLCLKGLNIIVLEKNK